MLSNVSMTPTMNPCFGHQHTSTVSLPRLGTILRQTAVFKTVRAFGRAQARQLTRPSSDLAEIAQLVPLEPTRHPSPSDVRFGGPRWIQVGRIGSPPEAHQTADPMQLLTRPYLAESLLRDSSCKALVVKRTTCEGQDHMA